MKTAILLVTVGFILGVGAEYLRGRHDRHELNQWKEIAAKNHDQTGHAQAAADGLRDEEQKKSLEIIRKLEADYRAEKKRADELSALLDLSINLPPK